MGILVRGLLFLHASQCRSMRKRPVEQQELGRRIRAARLGLGFSQEELAYPSDIDRSYIGGVERGEDMAQVMAECARVLKPGRICTAVVGTNSNQLSKILGVSPENVTGIDELIADWASSHRSHQIRKLSRQIKGMSNTMRTEHIVFLQKR